MVASYDYVLAKVCYGLYMVVRNKSVMIQEYAVLYRIVFKYCTVSTPEPCREELPDGLVCLNNNRDYMTVSNARL